MSFVLDPSLASALGWALIHSLWQCAALAALAWMGFRVLRDQGPQARYLLGCALLALMLALPAGTFLLLWTPVRVGAGAPMEEAQVALLVVRAAALPSDHLLRPFLPWLTAAWTAGVLAMSLRLVGGWCWIQRLRWRGADPVAAIWQERLDDMSQRMGLSRPVALSRSLRIEVPMVLGWLRPLILVPAALFTGMEPGALEAILAHELAHVRRHDYLANLLQSVVEVLLFFHPAVWWLSAQIRAERENCCDDIAVSICGDSLLYARALAALEELRQPLEPNPSLALAATGGTLMNRIRRLIAPKLPPSPAARAGLAAALAVSVLGAASTLGIHSQETPKVSGASAEGREEKKTVTVIVDKDAKSPQKLTIQMKGKVKIQPEAQPPVALEDGARLEIEGKDGDQLRTYRAERGPGGEKRLWTVEGKEQAPDAQAEAWLKKSLETAQKFTVHLNGKGMAHFGNTFHWKGLDPQAEHELKVQAKLLEEKAKSLAEKRLAKGVSEKELASLQEQIAKHAKDLATQARKLSHPPIDSDEIKVIVSQAKEEATHAKVLETEIRKRIVLKGDPKNGEPVIVQVEGEEAPGAMDIDVRTEGEGKRVIVQKVERRGENGEVIILRGHEGNPQAEIEALKKAIEKMQGRLDRLQMEAGKNPKAEPSK